MTVFFVLKLIVCGFHLSIWTWMVLNIYQNYFSTLESKTKSEYVQPYVVERQRLSFVVILISEYLQLNSENDNITFGDSLFKK